MDNDIKTIKALPDFKLQVELADGRRGVFDLKPYLGHPGMAALADPAYFNRVTVLMGAATWPGGEDIAPETLATQLQSLQVA
jgi:hypothetical protein